MRRDFNSNKQILLKKYADAVVQLTIQSGDLSIGKLTPPQLISMIVGYLGVGPNRAEWNIKCSYVHY